MDILFILFIIFLIVVIMIILLPKMARNILLDTAKLNKRYNFHMERHLSILQKQINPYVNIREKNIRVDDKIKLNLIHFTNPTVKNYIIISHPNAENLTESMYLISTLGHMASIIIYDYRGYGKSTGDTTEEGMYDDLLAIWNYTTKYVDPIYITLMGISFGSTISAHLMNKLCNSYHQMPHSLIMIGAFINHLEFRNDYIKNIINGPKIVTDIIGGLATYVADISLDTRRYIKKISNKRPILIAHSIEDKIVNISHSKRLMKSNKYMEFYKLRGPHTKPIFDNNFLMKIKEYLYE